MKFYCPWLVFSRSQFGGIYPNKANNESLTEVIHFQGIAINYTNNMVFAGSGEGGKT
jgi:hypothetical protein